MCNFMYKMSSPSPPTLKAETLSRKGLAGASQGAEEAQGPKSRPSVPG